MKKTKIIIPALAAVCVSAAASVTGTVAWFSASKNAKIEINNVAVINPEGSLTASVNAGYNTEKNDAGNAVSMKQVTGKTEYWKLRDFSMQFATTGTGDTKTVSTKQGWKATGAGNLSTDESWSTTYDTVPADDGYVADSNSHIAYLATWDLTLSVSGAPTDKYNINLDASSTISNQTSGQQLDAIFNGLRIAFVTDHDFFIWTPRTAKPANGFQYVNSSSIATRAAAPAYSADNIILYNSSKTLGKIGTGEDLNITCYMWLEGTDADVASSKLASGESVAAVSVMNFSASLAS